ncbi:MAG: ATP-binding protein [Pseudomonadota bacterium]
MKRWVEAFERYLRMPPEAESAWVMRIRAVWIIGLMVVASQLINLVLISHIYGRWTYDHTVIVSGIVIVLAAIAAMRWCKSPLVYALFYGVLLLALVLGSALPDQGGINTAALPLLALGPLMAGLMAGWRASLAFWTAGALVIGFLYWVSLGAPSMIAPYDYTRETNRFFQAIAALSIATAVAVIFQEQLYASMMEMRETARRAQRAEAVKSDFLATMSHELRTPLNGVIGLTDALMNADLPEHERKLTQTIRQSGESLLLILNDLLDLSKIEAGKLSIEARPTELRDLVRFVTDNWRETASAKGLSLHASVADDVPARVMIDDLRLRQVLQNLLSNAVKFTDAGQVILSLKTEDRPGGDMALVFRVRDTGRGVPKEQQTQIFEPFEQGERGTTRRYGGTGLGLPISRKLTNLMGGAISIERSGPDGATFKVVLPATLAPSPDTEAADDIYDAASELSNLRVLVAEDNEVNRMVAGEFLKSWGIKADFVIDGPSCINRLRAADYDLVLMDKHMPGMSGLQAAQRIRESNGPMANVPIIAVTADAMPGELDAMLAAGINDLVAKPLRAEALKAAIRRAVSSAAAA